MYGLVFQDYAKLQYYSSLLDQNKLKSSKESDIPFQPVSIVYMLSIDWKVIRIWERDFAGSTNYRCKSLTLKLDNKWLWLYLNCVHLPESV